MSNDKPKWLSIFFIFSLLAISKTGDSQSQATASGKVIAYKTNVPVKIDGMLNEPLWKKAMFSNKMYGKEDSVHFYSNTQAYLSYDADNLFVAFNCQVTDTSKLTKKKYHKNDESITHNEWVAFCVDSYDDGVSAYVFFVDAAGNQLEGALTPRNELTYSFSLKWTSAVRKNSDGYSVEMKIPLAKLPVKWNKDSVEMAVRLVRYDKENEREVQTPFLNTGITNRIIQFQKIVLKGIRQTHPDNLSGVNLQERLKIKKDRININTFEGRCRGGDASVMDYAIFKERIINGAVKTRIFPYSLKTQSVNHAFERTDFLKGYLKKYGFETFLEREQTTAFIVLSNDTIIYEKYYNGFNRNSVFTSFSIAKSFVSTLIGLAIADGFIKSDTDRITKYIPELLQKDKRFSDITIRDLLSMSSGLQYSGDGEPSDDDITYQYPDLRKAALQFSKVKDSSGKLWQYNNYNPLLLGLILERTTHSSVSKYMEEKLWKKMGGSRAGWSVDEHGFEKLESGINCSAYDYIRFGQLFLNKGKYNGVQIVPAEWIQRATQPASRPRGYYDFLLRHNVYYGYFWWGKFRGSPANDNDFFGLGNKGQYLYVCPQKKLVIIRLGFEYGLPSPGAYSWPDLFYQFATNFSK
jgi:CubicO group peptidase (beta-lactamase class C family)